MNKKKLFTLKLTNSATEKIKKLIKNKKKKVFLRIFIEGGGCNGFQYGFTLDKKIQSDDYILKQNSVQVAVDPISFQYLSGSTLDYNEGLNGSRFFITNPNAQTTCSCGSSFSFNF